jgi:anti-sigma-K factor RskA
MMKVHELHDDNLLAGEYVLGALDDSERQAFERRLPGDLRLQAEVDAWERRLGPVLETIEPVTPPASVWASLERRTTPEERVARQAAGFWSSLSFWRGLATVTSALVLGMALTLFSIQRADLNMDSMMVVLNDQSTTGWIVAAQQGSKYIHVRAVAPSTLPKGKVCQLWMKDEAGNLHPLGILPHRGKMQMPMPEGQASNPIFLVSIENEADMPTKDPSREIVFRGKLTEI